MRQYQCMTLFNDGVVFDNIVSHLRLIDVKSLQLTCQQVNNNVLFNSQAFKKRKIRINADNVTNLVRRQYPRPWKAAKVALPIPIETLLEMKVLWGELEHLHLYYDGLINFDTDVASFLIPILTNCRKLTSFTIDPRILLTNPNLLGTLPRPDQIRCFEIDSTIHSKQNDDMLMWNLDVSQQSTTPLKLTTFKCTYVIPPLSPFISNELLQNVTELQIGSVMSIWAELTCMPTLKSLDAMFYGGSVHVNALYKEFNTFLSKQPLLTSLNICGSSIAVFPSELFKTIINRGSRLRHLKIHANHFENGSENNEIRFANFVSLKTIDLQIQGWYSKQFEHLSQPTISDIFDSLPSTVSEVTLDGFAHGFVDVPQRPKSVIEEKLRRGFSKKFGDLAKYNCIHYT